MQLAGLEYSIEEYGDLSGITFNVRTRNLVGGHQRVTALKNKFGSIPIGEIPRIEPGAESFADVITPSGRFRVRFVNWPIEKEKEANIAANSPTIAGTFSESVIPLLQEVQLSNPEAFAKMDFGRIELPQIAESTALDPTVADDENEVEDNDSVQQFKLDAVFPSSTKWGLPDLLPNMLYDPHDKPVDTWWTRAKDDGNSLYLAVYQNTTLANGFPFDRGILAFYTYDGKFEDVWTKIDLYTPKFLRMGFGAIITPNYSLYARDPAVVRLYRTFKSRWMGRYWQGAGIPIIPDIEFSFGNGGFDTEYVFDGIPQGLPCVSMQMQARYNLDEEAELYGFVEMILARLNPQHFLVYSPKLKAQLTARFPKCKFVFMPTINEQLATLPGRGSKKKRKK